MKYSMVAKVYTIKTESYNHGRWHAPVVLDGVYGTKKHAEMVAESYAKNRKANPAIYDNEEGFRVMIVEHEIMTEGDTIYENFEEEV